VASASYAAADFEIGLPIQAVENDQLMQACARKNAAPTGSLDLNCNCLVDALQKNMSKVQRAVVMDGLEGKKSDPRPVWASARKLGLEEIIKQHLDPEQLAKASIRVLLPCTTNLPDGATADQIMEEVKKRRAGSAVK
jgi:tRNA pseudouridine-54 N-methylase